MGYWEAYIISDVVVLVPSLDKNIIWKRALLQTSSTSLYNIQSLKSVDKVLLKSGVLSLEVLQL